MTSELWKERIQNYFKTIIGQKEDILQIRLIGATDNGKEIIRIQRDSGNKISITPNHLLQQKGQYKYYKKTISLHPGEIYISKINLNRENGKIEYPHQPVIRMATPLFDTQNNIFGIIIVNISFSKLIYALTGHNNEKKLNFYIITNSKGQYLYHPNPEKAFSFELGKEYTIFQDFNVDTLQAKHLFKAKNSDRQLLLTKLFFDPLHKQRFVYIGIVISHRFIKEASKRLLTKIILVALLGMVLLTIGTYIGIKLLLHPITILTEEANAIALGKESVSIDINRTDELGILAKSFRTMIQQVKQSQQNLKELNENLEEQVRQRTKELNDTLKRFEESQASLLHAEKLVSIGELSAGVGHEINNPLAIANGTVQILAKRLKQKNLLDENIKKSLSTIHDAHNRIKNIVNGLRVYARNNGDQIEIIDTEEIIANTVNMVTGIYEKEGIQIDISSDDQLKTCSGNKGKLQQVIMNFITNAKDAVEDNSDAKLISIKQYRVGPKIKIEISDNGKGISPEHMTKIFDSFFTTKEVGKGTGLGMSISNSIVNEMNGTIDVQSQIGKGTTFTLTFPFAEHVQNSKMLSQQNSLQATPITQLQGNILVVDDEDGIRELLTTMLEDIGLTVDTANNGQEAFEKVIQNNKYDVILTDMQMPKLDGAGLIKQLKQLDNFTADIIIVTGGLNSQSDADSFKDQIFALLDKPFTAEEVYLLLAKSLNKLCDYPKKAA